MKEKGQSLIEVLVALAISVVVITAVTLATISALYNSQFSKNQNLASQYAQQGMEIIRKIKVSDPSTFSSLSGEYCMAEGCTLLNGNIGDDCGPPSGNCNSKKTGEIFVREANIDRQSSRCDPDNVGSPSAVEAKVSVSWSDGKCPLDNVYCHSAELVSCLSVTDLIPTP